MYVALYILNAFQVSEEIKSTGDLGGIQTHDFLLASADALSLNHRACPVTAVRCDCCWMFFSQTLQTDYWTECGTLS